MNDDANISGSICCRQEIAMWNIEADLRLIQLPVIYHRFCTLIINRSTLNVEH